MNLSTLIKVASLKYQLEPSADNPELAELSNHLEPLARDNWLKRYKPLTTAHLEQLHNESAIGFKEIASRGYRSVEESDPSLKSFSPRQRRAGILMPVHTVDGQSPLSILRPDSPRVTEKGKRQYDPEVGETVRKTKIIKYEFPENETKRLDIPPIALKRVKDTSSQLWITEGIKKADALATVGKAVVMVDGVWAWRNEHGTLPDWEGVPLKNREVVLAFDSDAWSNAHVMSALNRLAGWVRMKGGKAIKLVLPKVDGNSKTGIDDWLAAGGTVSELDRLVEQAMALQTQAEDDSASKTAEFIDLLEAQLGYYFRLNELTEVLEVNGEPIDDYKRFEIRSKLRDAGYQRRLTAIEEAWHVNASRRRYHPVRDYLNGLSWDGHDHIGRLCNFFHADKISIGGEMWNPLPLWLHKWLVGSVARMLKKTPVRSAVLVLDGVQDVGKSTFSRWICPIPEFFIDEVVDPTNKDHALLMARKWIWEIGEIGAAFRKRDIEQLKAFFTKQVVDVRGAYQKYNTRARAVASFIGTVNDAGGFLADPTGSTRFMVSTIKHIDFRYSQDVNIDDIWGQAVALFKQGFDWRLSRSEKNVQAEINALYQIENPVTQLVLKYFRVDPTSEEFYSTLEIMEELGFDATRSTSTKVGTALSELGLRKTRKTSEGQRLYGYEGLKRRTLEKLEGI